MVSVPDAISDRAHMYLGNYVGYASFSIAVWDHIITFDQEVEYFWLPKKNLVISLFLINRYAIPLGFFASSVLVANLSHVWTPESCSHILRFDMAMAVIGIHIVALMMFTRIRALYYNQKVVLGFVVLLGLASLIANAYSLTRGVIFVHNPESGVHACTVVYFDKLASTSIKLPLVYDTLVLGLTLYKTYSSLRNKTTSYVMRRLAKDGILYYSVIFSNALIWNVMMEAAPPGIQNIAAPSYVLLTVAAMSRISINLRSSVQKMKDVNVVRPVLPKMFTQHSHLEVASDIKIVAPGFNQTKTVDSLDFGLELSTLDLRRGQPNSGTANTLGSIKSATPNRPRLESLDTILQESSDWEHSSV